MVEQLACSTEASKGQRVPKTSGRLFLPVKGKRFESLLMLIKRYHGEAIRSANAGAYLGACILTGAALEAALLATCSVQEEEVEEYLSQPEGQRVLRKLKRKQSGLPVKADKLALADLLNLARHLGWLPGRTGKYQRRKVGDLALVVKELRDLVHPGKYVRDYPNVRIARWHAADVRRVFELGSAYLLDVVERSLRKEMDRLRNSGESRRSVWRYVASRRLGKQAGGEANDVASHERKGRAGKGS